jgi:outer membrane protein assembly factor BamB
VEHEHVDGEHDNLAVTRAHRFVVLAISRVDGTILWQRSVREAIPHEGGHTTGSLASASPVTDGKHLVAFFGSRGLFVFTLDGELLWEKDFGEMQTKHAHGEGSSPVLHENMVIVNWDHDGDSFVTALDKKTGDELWKITRNEGTSWSTPLVVPHDDRHQVVISATKRIRSYDLKTGDLIWECAGLSDNVVASPVTRKIVLPAIVLPQQ